jgi:acetamidase/formamidase
MQKSHRLAATPNTVHWGYFDAAMPPVLRVASGDRVVIETISGNERNQPVGLSGFDILPEYAAVHARHRQAYGPHIMTGPIHVEGAERGDTLEIRIIDIELRQNWGYNVIQPLAGALPEDFGETDRIIHIPIDIEAKIARLSWGPTLKLAPFFGNMATAPTPAYGRVTSMIPREFGGNIDNKELQAGATLFLPVFNNGAMFSVGDGHAIQGDGEVCVTAIETALRGTFEFIVRKDMHLRLPQAETPTHYLTMAFNVDLDFAAKEALREMLKLVQEKAKISREDAYTFVSLAGDVRVTQLVNGNKGIHVMVPKALLQPSTKQEKVDVK